MADRILIVLLAVCLLSLPARGEPTVGAEFDLGPPSYVAAANIQGSPSVAFNGTNYLVVWSDYRDAANSYIHGTRVSLDGQVLDPEGGLRVQVSEGSFATSTAANPVVASDGQDFLVLWQEQNGLIRGARVTSAGEVFTKGIGISGIGLELAFNGSNYLLIWNSAGKIYGARLDRNGTVLDPGGFAICTTTNSQYGQLDHKVVRLGVNWLVAWSDFRREHSGYSQDGDVYGTLVSPSGTVLIPDGFKICATNNQQRLDQLCTLGNTCLASWRDGRGSAFGFNTDIYATRITSAGQILDTNGFVVVNSSQSESQSFASTDGDQWVMLWSAGIDSDHSQVRGRKISQQKVMGDTLSFETVTRQYANPKLIFGKSNYFAVWEANRIGPYTVDVVGSQIAPDGTQLNDPAFPVSLSANPQMQPAIASDGTNYLLVWSDGRAGDQQWNIYGARITRAGQVLDVGGFPITTFNSAQTNPAVAFNGKGFLVVWGDMRTGGGDIYGARVSIDGRVLDTNGFPIAIATGFARELNPAVASNGDNFLVAWGERVDSSSQKVACMRVSEAGQILDTAPIVLSVDYGSYPAPRVASNGTNYFVAWRGNYQGGAATISGSGTVVSPSVGTYYSGQQLSSSGDSFLLVANSASGVYGNFYTGMGTLFTDFQIAPIFYNNYGYNQAVTSDGIDYFLAYNTHGPGDPVFFTQISASGRVINTNGIQVANDVVSMTDLALAGNKRNNYLLAYSKLNPYAVSRLQLRILDATPRLVNPLIQSGQFAFTLDGTAERVYDVESSPDLRTWSVSKQLTNQNGRVDFSTNTTLGNRFYRVRQVN